MSKLQNFYTVPPQELSFGDVMAAVVTCHIVLIDEETDTVYVKVYRCGYPDPPTDYDGIPQGSHVGNDAEIARTLFPVLNYWTNVDTL